MAVTLARLIRQARHRAGLTQAQLARAVGCSTENIAAIENARNRQPSPEVITGLSQALTLAVEDIYAAITGTLDHLPWERNGEPDLRDPELELMFRQLERLPRGEARDRVKAFIRFTLEEERRRPAPGQRQGGK